jgi:hypothetical protein
MKAKALSCAVETDELFKGIAPNDTKAAAIKTTTRITAKSIFVTRFI